MSQSQIISVFFILFCLLYFSCSNGKKTTDLSVENTTQLWKQNCALCHGMDGKMGLNGAKDLSISTTSLADRITVIKKGKGKMIGFENSLSDKEVEALASFTMSFK